MAERVRGWLSAAAKLVARPPAAAAIVRGALFHYVRFVGNGWAPLRNVDKALLVNCLHHMSDAQARAALAKLARLVRHCLVAADPDPEASNWLQAFLLRHDRGHFIRSRSAQRALLSEHFTVTNQTGAARQPLLRPAVGQSFQTQDPEDRHQRVAHFFKEYEYAVGRYQIVQEAGNQLRVRLIRKSRFTRDTERDIRRGLAEVLGQDMELQFELVDVTPLERTGKAQSCICKIEVPLFSAEAAEAWEQEACREAAG